MIQSTIEIATNPWVAGIGGSIIAGLVLYFIFGIGRAKKREEPPKSSVTPKQLASSPRSTITPNEIYQAINKLPPFQIEQASKNYKGLEIEWLVTLCSTFTNRKNENYLITNPPEHIAPKIVFPINFEQYPQLKIMEKGKEFTIRGTIVSVVGFSINLENCSLYFH